MAKRQIRVTGVVRSGRGKVSEAISATPWAQAFYPGSINLYVLGKLPGHGGDAVGIWRRPYDGNLPPHFTPCKLNGIDGYIVNVHGPYPQRFNAPSDADYSMFEIVALVKIPGVEPDARMTLEYEWDD